MARSLSDRPPRPPVKSILMSRLTWEPGRTMPSRSGIHVTGYWG
ncbi:MAG: hypothetical protein AVDCRST_MAG91-1413 [uncultured Sphingomonadaceae bacterium]|uniref:Uncharacterized protein n=1 Tax=uncultured Sphingomonadaceae bacterium TaxID=169976 RepID=A0A6J4SW81_9SPHN|nr:MAG: hypothetical protein AVDCRST_MAG91-1413 [uncultured Sphingomonadaceae bacterium]